MASYAVLDENNIVVDVFIGNDENFDETNWEQWYSEFLGKQCKRTSYNTKAGVHILGGTPFRYNYAGIGYSYDENLDAFIPPKPYNSWILNETKCIWESPIEYPTDGKYYRWNEDSTSWYEVPTTANQGN